MTMNVSDSKFAGGKFTLDGGRFVRTTFEGVELLYSGGDLPIIEDCVFTGCTFAFAGPAANTLEFLTSLYKSGGTTVIQDLIRHISQGALK